MTPSISISPPNAVDIDGIKEILTYWKRDIHGVPLVDDIKQSIAWVTASIDGDNRHSFLVAKDGDIVVGVMGLTAINIDKALYESTDKPVEFDTAYVANAYRGQGIGGRLADHLEQLAIERGYTKLIVVSGSRSRTGYPFWTKRYGDAMINENYFGHGQERVVWRKVLQA